MAEPKKGDELNYALLFSTLAQQSSMKYTDAELNNLRALGPFMYQGDVPTYADLPATSTKGYVYGVEDSDKEYMWTGVAWREFGPDLTLILQDIADLKESKVNVEQGTENAGKSLVIDESGNVVPGGAVRYDVSQVHTDEQKNTARQNIGAYAKPSGGIPEADLSQDVQNTMDSSVHSDVIATDYANLIFPVSKDKLCMHQRHFYRAVQDITTAEEFTPAHWIETSAEDEFMKQVYVTVTLTDYDGIQPNDLTVKVTNTATGETIRSEEYNGQPLTFKLLQGMKYTIAPSGSWRGHLDPSPSSVSGEAIQNSSVTFLYPTVSDLKFGVSGVGNTNRNLTRLWDSVGLTATPSTDTVEGSSGFDPYEPFNRKRVVGSWSLVGGKAVFTPQAYYGDADYTEDGSMGDYVAIDVTPFFYIEADGTIGVSARQHAGWSPHPVCLDADGNLREHTYLPCYALTQKDGQAVSLPGYTNVSGDYIGLWNKARTYGDGSLSNFITLEPSVVDHYNWLLVTIEYATQDIQQYIKGTGSLVGSTPWQTGCCNEVLGHTGSPVSNTDGNHPCRYRWVENPWANQNMTAADLMDVRVDEGDGKYHLDWYYCNDLAAWIAAGVKNPDVADLVPAKGWVKLGVTTDSDHYVSGYIKELSADPNYPAIRVPTNTSGGSDTTYYCDYAYLVNSDVVRAVRRRGNLAVGAYSGPCYVFAYSAPSYSFWYSGGGLFFIQ